MLDHAVFHQSVANLIVFACCGACVLIRLISYMGPFFFKQKKLLWSTLGRYILCLLLAGIR